jgi:protein LTV1
VLDDDRF